MRFERIDAESLVQNARKVEEFIINNIKYHSAEQEEQANKRRTAARNFKVGDLVWLNCKNIKSLRPCRKLDFKYGGPFKIVELVGNYAYKLDLPKTAKIHPVFHVSLLSPVAADPLPGQNSGPSPELNVNDHSQEYEVEKILGTHWNNGELHYLIRWKGYGPEDDWSIPASQTDGFHDLVEEFHALNPSEPRPNTATPDPKPKSRKKIMKKSSSKPHRSSARLRGGNVRNGGC